MLFCLCIWAAICFRYQHILPNLTNCVFSNLVCTFHPKNIIINIIAINIVIIITIIIIIIIVQVHPLVAARED